MAAWFGKLMSPQSEYGTESLEDSCGIIFLKEAKASMMSAVPAAAVIDAFLKNDTAEVGAPMVPFPRTSFISGQ